MRPAILVALLLLVCGRSHAEEFPNTGPCGDAARGELARAIASGDAAWAVAILRQNQRACSGFEYYFRATVITALMGGEDPPEADSDQILRHVQEFLERISRLRIHGDTLYMSTSDRARRLRSELPAGSEGHLYALLYSGDDLETFVALLFGVPRPDCPLREALWQHQAALKRQIRCAEAKEKRAAQRNLRQAGYRGTGWSIRFGPGCWLPAGDFARFGPHFIVDDLIGCYRGRVGIDLATSLRLLSAKDPYQIEIEGTSLERSDYLGVYAGAEIGVTVLAYDRLAVALACGVGLDVLGGQNAERYGSTYSFSGVVLKAGTVVSYRLNPPYILFADLRYNRHQYFGGFVDGERHEQNLAGDAFSFVAGLGMLLETRR